MADMDSHHPPRNIDQIIEQQVQRWELEKRARDEHQEKKPEAAEAWPVITVSREFGSQGARVGELVAKKLGFSFWDQELVHEVSQRSGSREALVQSLDEHVKSRIDDFIAHVFRGGEGASDEYVRQIGHVVHTLERHGGAVIVGRGAQFVVDPDHALRVRFVCPREKRIAGYAQRQGADEDAAVRKVDGTERERHVFYRKYYDRDVTDPLHYDMVLNTASMSLDALADVVIAAYQKKHGRLPV